MDKVTNTLWGQFSDIGSDIYRAWLNGECHIYFGPDLIIGLGDTPRFVHLKDRGFVPIDDAMPLRVTWVPTREELESAIRQRDIELNSLRHRITSPYQMGEYTVTPMAIYIQNDGKGAPLQARLYNVSNAHAFTGEETQKVITLLQAFVDSEAKPHSPTSSSKVIARLIELRQEYQSKNLTEWGKINLVGVAGEMFMLGPSALDTLIALEERAKGLMNTLIEIQRMAQADADGHDEINEHTPDLYIAMLEGALDNIRHEANAAIGQFGGGQNGA